MSTGDAHWMERALRLAEVAMGTVAPNPAVGAILVRQGAVLGQGWTRPAGGHHAEIVALHDCRDQGVDTAGATMVVTLEPCCHHGRTPPCTDAILAAGVTRVVVGALDPFHKNRGAAIASLRAAGVEVTLGVLEDACARQVLGFARSIEAGLPEVTLKAAISADGRIATETGESKWITGPMARQDGHALRAAHDALLVGIGTALADDPRLTARVAPSDEAVRVHPTPVVLDTDLRLPASAQLLRSPTRAVVIAADDAPARELTAHIVRVPRGPGGVDLQAALEALAERGLHRVLVEGGGRVHRGLLQAGLADTLHLYVAGVVVPGGVPWVGGPAISALDDALRMSLRDLTRLGPDARLTYDLTHAVSPDPHAALRSPSERQAVRTPQTRGDDV